MSAINVKVIDEVIEVPAVEAVRYRKVDREAAVGDVIKFTDRISGYLTHNGFYAVISFDSEGYPQIIDNDGDEYDLSRDDYEVFEKFTEAAESSELFTYENVQYRKVKRRANVGELVLYMSDTRVARTIPEGGICDISVETYIGTANGASDMFVLEPVVNETTYVQDGTVYRPTVAGEKPTHFIRKPDATTREKVLSGKVYEIIRIDGDGDFVLISEDGSKVYSISRNSIGLVRKEPAVQPKSARIPVGAYVKITDATRSNVGAVAKVINDDGTNFYPYKCELLDGSNFNYFYAKEFEVLSEADAKAAVDAETDRKKWAAIGRKVNEYKTGDVVEIVEYRGGDVVGTVTTVLNEDDDTLRLFTPNYPHVRTGFYHRPYTVKLITPVEQRFDRQ